VPARATDHADTGAGYGRLLTDRVFAPFFYTNALSNIGNWFQNVAAGIVIYELTGSNTAVGTVSMLQFAATMLLTPWMGGFTDRMNRQRLLFAGQATAFGAASVLAVTVFATGVDGLPGPWPVYAATAVIGLGSAVVLPSLQAIVPALVRRADLDRAITLSSMTFNIARGIGPVLAGAVVATSGAQWAFGINAITFAPLLVVLWALQVRGDVSPRKPDTSVVADVVEGLRWIRSQPEVQALLAATLVVGWTSDPLSTLTPALAEALNGGDATVGLLVGCFGMGAALCTTGAGAIRRRFGRARQVPVGFFLVTAGLGAMATAPVTAVALAGAAVAGAGFLLGVTGTNADLQKAIPERLRGRVMAWWSVAFLGCRPLAALVDGVVADLTDVRIALAASAAVSLVAGALLWRTGLAATTGTGTDTGTDTGTGTGTG
jgi:MFS family permease